MAGSEPSVGDRVVALRDLTTDAGRPVARGDTGWVIGGRGSDLIVEWSRYPVDDGVHPQGDLRIYQPRRQHGSS